MKKSIIFIIVVMTVVINCAKAQNPNGLWYAQGSDTTLTNRVAVINNDLIVK